MGIALNVVALGFYDRPAAAYVLVSPENSQMTAQVVFADGGNEVQLWKGRAA